ncbi:fasciclin-like arabinogalactan protein 7 isoform X1 [Juglans microcarpa x Juglans regia]|uniref:fasciclin-like arabinogalactan protein 7 isoform X1 n=2 Tax=Juglans microcarpa x Juglans regia TaxID=2249226 RepID=UPI001B7EE6FC|nr:fasciclin-like arabinogalactan protein 7 isoform X1 [Juglans microcarpa x Juglans regia]
MNPSLYKLKRHWHCHLHSIFIPHLSLSLSLSFSLSEFLFVRNLESPVSLGINSRLMKNMEVPMIFMVSCTLLLLCSSSAYAQTAKSPSISPTPSPAPAPAPEYVNLTDLLTVAGPFHTFLSYLESTKVIDTFQNQANNTEEGITIFVPKDGAFSSLKKPSLSNLTKVQLKSLILFHGLPHYYSLAEFKNLSESGPVPTFAGGQYTLNFSDVSGTVNIGSGWTNTKVSSSVHSTDPVAVYQVDKVLLPEAIFGTDIPPTPAPAPSSDISPAADTPSEGTNGEGSSPTSAPGKSNSYRMINWGIWSHLVLALSGVLVFFL